MAIMVPSQLNWLFFSLIGETFLQADEDEAYMQSKPYARLHREVQGLKSMMSEAGRSVGGRLPEGTERQFLAALRGVLPYLDDFADQLQSLAVAQVQVSVQIREAKWSLIGELVRLLFELAVLAVMCAFTGGATAGQMVVARLRSRAVLLAILSDLFERTHVLPSLTQAVEEAFQTLAVRLAMLTLNPPGQRPKGINWDDIGISAFFGGLAGGLVGALTTMAKGFTDRLGNIFKNKSDIDNLFKDRPAGPDGGGKAHVPDHTNHTDDLDDFDLPGAPSGNGSLFGTSLYEVGQFGAFGLAEALAEIPVNGLFFGSWSTSWQTFVGAGLSERFEHRLETGVVNSIDWAKSTFSPSTGTPVYMAPPNTRGTSDASVSTTTATRRRETPDPFRAHATEHSVSSVEPLAQSIFQGLMAPTAAPLPFTPQAHVYASPPLSSDQRLSGPADVRATSRDVVASTPSEPDVLPTTTELTRTRITVPDGVEQPASARAELNRVLNRILRNDTVAANVLHSGARIVVVPRDTRVTDLPDFAHLTNIPEHTDPVATRTADALRALTDPGHRIVAVPEENLLGEVATAGPHGHFPDGYSAVAHELAHLVHLWGLSDEQRAQVDALHAAKLVQGPDSEWPDGPRRNAQNVPTENYSSRSPAEYFAQLTTAYLGANKGTDPFTDRPRNNGPDAVHAHEPQEAGRLMVALYGDRPATLSSNPVVDTRRLNAMYDAWNDFDHLLGIPAIGFASPRDEDDSATDLSAVPKSVTEYVPSVQTDTAPDAVPETESRTEPHLQSGIDPARKSDNTPGPNTETGGPEGEWETTETELVLAQPETAEKAAESDGHRPTDAVATFGTQGNGALDFAHITPVPEHVVEWLQEQVIATAEDGRCEDADLRAAVRKTLTARTVTGEWSRLLSDAGLPLNVTSRGQRYPVSLRLRLALIGPAPEQLEPMPDGPPVGVQRWAFGVHEDGDTSGSGDLRGFSSTFSLPWAAKHGALSGFTFAPQVNLTWNQLTTTMTAGRTVQPMVLLRSKGRSLPYDFAMTWEVRRNTGTPGDIFSNSGQPDWRSAGTTPARPHAPDSPSPLTVWFPAYLARPPERKDEQQTEDGKREETLRSQPVPAERLLDELPLFGPESLVDHDTMFADLVEAFPHHLRELSDGSTDELFEFLKEGNQRANLPQSWAGSVASPTLYSASGSAIGYLRFSAHLSGGTTVTGPATSSSVLESYVLRSIRMQGTSQIANTLGITLPVRFGLSSGDADPVTGTESPGGSVSGQAGASRQFAHSLTSAGSARIAHSLRTGEPLLQVSADLRLTVTLVRPDSAPVEPAADSGLGKGRTYPLKMRVPSLHTLGEKPKKKRYPPREVLHLKQLGVSTTPLQVSGTEPLFDQTERWLRENGYLPPDRPRPRLQDHATEEALRVQRLNNQRKLDRMRSRLGLRSALDEMIEGGDAITFEVPAPHVTRRATVRLSTERRYTGIFDDDGVVHERALPRVQTLNYVGSTTAGDEQFQRTPFAWSVGGGASVTNPFGVHGNQVVQEVGVRHTYARARSTTAGSSAGTGHEYYMLSPTANGTQTFSVPVTHKLEITDSHVEGLTTDPVEGSVRLAVPTDRTSEKPATGPRAKPAVVRDVRDADRRRLAQPAVGHSYHDGVLRLPETALLERVPGSAELRGLVPRMLDEIDKEATRQEQLALRARAPMPGAFPGDIDLEALDEDTDVDGDGEPAGRIRTVAEGGTRTEPDTDDTVPTAGSASAPARRGLLMDLLHGAGSWVGGQAAGAARWAWRTAFGETATRGESSAREVFDTAFSPQHMAGHALRVYRDSYLVESAGTPGLVAGTDYLVEVEGSLTDVELLPEGQQMDAERWLQSVDASASTSGVSWSHQVKLSTSGRYGSKDRVFTPSGDYGYRRGSGRSVTVNESTNVFRVTVEDTTPVYRLTAKAHLVVTVRRGRRNAASGSFRSHPALSITKVLEPDETLEFLLVDNDLQNHPDLAALVERSGRTPLGANRDDRPLPAPYVSSGGVLGFGATSEVHLRHGRKAFTERIRTLVEREAPGSTEPGEATYLPGVLSRINEHGSSLGLRALVNAGPRGHTAFHFVHRSWLGPRLVEVTLVARPARTAGLADLRGKLVTRSSGLDNVFGHSRGDGAALDVPGATRIGRSTGDSHELSFSPAGQSGAHRLRPSTGIARRTTWVDAQLSSRELRSWQRSFGNTAEFHVPYEYVVTVRSWTLDDALTGKLIDGLGDGFASLAALAGAVVIPSPRVIADLPVAPGRTGIEPADTVLRFNASETTGDSTALLEGPGLFSSDPRIAPSPRTGPGDTVIEMEVPEDLSQMVTGPGWRPSRPFQVYDFAGTEELTDALRTVDPSLRRELKPRTTKSAEGLFIRLASLAADGRLSLLDAAATAPFLGGPGGGRTSVSLRLYAPRAELTSRDTAIDRIEVSTDGFQTQTDTVMASGVQLEYSGGSGRRGGVSVPLAGERASLGQHATASSQRRELLRFGTPMENDRGEGTPGHRVRAVAVLEVRGPREARWVTGDILFRTTEPPPAGDVNHRIPPGRSGERSPGRAELSDLGYDTDRPVPRYGGGRRLLTAYQWARLDAVGATPHDVSADGDCFFRAVLEVAGPHVRRRLEVAETDGLGDVIKKMRSSIASELTDHTDRYAAHLVGLGTSTTVERLAASIRTRGNYANLAGDVTPWIAAAALGLRLHVVTPTHEVSMGPEDGVPVILVQTTNGPLHFMAAGTLHAETSTGSSSRGVDA